jgi:NADH-quinone oxidoreductase chain G
MNFQIVINSKLVNVTNNMSIFQACESVNITVPRFCYHERLSIAGNCRMCLVEIDKAPKLVASCAMPTLKNMVVYTNSLSVKKAREGILEFLLVNHPLDCPICDQAGECDLQDQTMLFGSDRSRFREYKRAIQDKHFGPLIKTIMTRCIHCTRCVRFSNEVIGFPDLGTSGRGNLIEISLYIKNLFKSEFSGNVVDLCPVGALTAKPYIFIARPWELKSIQSIDTFDGIGCNIRIDIRGYEIMRILPRLNVKINEEWISDKTRFSFDGLKRQRLYDPLIKKKTGKFKIVSWQIALDKIAYQINLIDKPFKCGSHIGSQIDIESVFLLKYLIAKKNGIFVNFDKIGHNEFDFQISYRFNTTLINVSSVDFCIILGLNARIEGAILNLRLRKNYILGKAKVVYFGTNVNLTFPVYNLGSSIKSLIKFAKGKHPFCANFVKSKKPAIIIGQSFFFMLGCNKATILLEILTKNSSLLKNNWNGLNYLHSSASAVGAFEMGVKTKYATNLKLSFLYCVGESYFIRNFKHTFIVYQGHQGSTHLNMVDLILPCSAFTEKSTTFVNTEGRFQKTKLALLPPGNAKEDQTILYAIIDKLSFGITINSTSLLYKRLFELVTETNSKKLSASILYISKTKLKIRFIGKNTFLPSSKIENFYLADSISKVSPIMSKCSKSILEKSSFI